VHPTPPTLGISSGPPPVLFAPLWCLPGSGALCWLPGVAGALRRLLCQHDNAEEASSLFLPGHRFTPNERGKMPRLLWPAPYRQRLAGLVLVPQASRLPVFPPPAESKSQSTRPPGRRRYGRPTPRLPCSVPPASRRPCLRTAGVSPALSSVPLRAPDTASRCRGPCPEPCAALRSQTCSSRKPFRR